MIKTAIENRQNLIVEGCYIPFDWRKDFDDEYLSSLRFICLAMTDRYIDAHFEQIAGHASEIEDRQDDSGCNAAVLKESNQTMIKGYQSAGEQVVLIDSEYDPVITRLLD